MARSNTEHQIQCAIVEFWNYRGRRDLDLFAIPNGGIRNIVTAKRLKAEGVKAGVPDMCVTLPGGRVGWLEVKAIRGRLSDEQKELATRWQALGHLYAIVRDVKDAAIILALWGALRGGKESAD